MSSPKVLPIFALSLTIIVPIDTLSNEPCTPNSHDNVLSSLFNFIRNTSSMSECVVPAAIQRTDKFYRANQMRDSEFRMKLEDQKPQKTKFELDEISNQMVGVERSNDQNETHNQVVRGYKLRGVEAK